MNPSFSVPFDLRRYSNRANTASKPVKEVTFDLPPDNDEQPAPVVDHSTARTKLEVLKAWEINFATSCLYFSSLIAFVYMAVTMWITRADWSQSHLVPQPSFLDMFLGESLRIVCIILPVVYCGLVAISGSVTPEQLWTGALLLVGLFLRNPLAFNVHRQNTWNVLNEAVYASVHYLYLLLSIHSYRTTKSDDSFFTHVYRWHFVIAVSYLVVRLLIGYFARVLFGIVPFSSFVVWLMAPMEIQKLDRVIGPVILLTVLDTIILAWMVREFAYTTKYLSRKPYLENRTKQLGFRCFVYQSFVFFTSVLMLSNASILFLPKNILVGKSFFLNTAQIISLELGVGNYCIFLVYVSWLLVLAYVNLPPGSQVILVQNFVSTIIAAFSVSSFASWLRKLGLPIKMLATDSEIDHYSECWSSDLRRNHAPFRYRHRERIEEGQETLHFHELVFENRIQRKFYAHDGNEEVESVKVFSGEKRRSIVDENGYDSGRRPYPEYVIGTKGQAKTLHPKFFMEEERQQEESNVLDSFRSMNREERIRIPVFPGNEPAGINYSSPKIENEEQTTGPGSSNGNLSLDVSIAGKSDYVRPRKNVFVMETQVLLANVAYLAYIPRNAKEEHLYSPADYAPPPNYDNGKKFRVDVAQLSALHGFTVFRQISNEKTNTHVSILIGRGRVIVAFSGTRDKRNWETNSRMERLVYNDSFPCFEYEIANKKDLKKRKCTDYRYLLAEGKPPQVIGISPEASNETHMAGALGLLGNNTSRFYHLRSKSVGSGIPVRAHERSRYGSVIEERSYSLGTTRKKKIDMKIKPLADNVAHEILTLGKSKVHRGFAEAYKSVRKELMGALMELYGGLGSDSDEEPAPKSIAHDLPLYICGHSLGGALAVLSAFEIAKYYKKIGIRNRDDISCSTFGCPMVGNEIFKKKYEKVVGNHWRFEMASDPVPKLLSLFNYTHVGIQVLMDQSGMILIDPSFLEMHWWGKLTTFYLKYKLHIRASYISALRSYCILYRNGADDMRSSFWEFPIKAQTRGLFDVLEEQ